VARANNDNGWPGYDSFLDIVANMVGILIILVLVVGIRVRRAPVEPTEADPQLAAATEKVDKQRATVAELRKQVLAVGNQLRRLEQRAVLQRAERDQLAALVAAWEQKLREGENSLSATQRAVYGLERQLASAEKRYGDLIAELAAASQQEQQPQVLLNYPTPLAQAVEGPEAHFQLRAGRIAYIPLEKLLEEVRREGRRRALELLTEPQLTETVGPVGGFRLRFTLRRYDVPVRSSSGVQRTASFARVERWTLIPTSPALGEPVAEALRSGSNFRNVLSRLAPERSTVTVWVYPDSFGAYQQIKRFLHEQGYSCAARPLPHGIPIAGSPGGTRSQAE